MDEKKLLEDRLTENWYYFKEEDEIFLTQEVIDNISIDNWLISYELIYWTKKEINFNNENK